MKILMLYFAQPCMGHNVCRILTVFQPSVYIHIGHLCCLTQNKHIHLYPGCLNVCESVYVYVHVCVLLMLMYCCCVKSSQLPCVRSIHTKAISITHTNTHMLRYAHVLKYTCAILVPLSISVIPAVSLSSSDDLTVDSIIRKPLLVAPSVGAEVILYAVVTAVPCPSIQWRLNGSAVSNGGNYLIGDPCSSAPAGTTTFNFTLTITTNTATVGTYNAILINPAGRANTSDVFVTPPGSWLSEIKL